MVRLVSDEVAEKVHEIGGEILPGRWRDRATSRLCEPNQFNDAAATALECARQLGRTNRASIDVSRNGNAMALAYHLDPHTPGVVYVSRKHPNRAARRAGDIHGPQLGRQVFDEVDGDAVVCVPRGYQILRVFTIFRQLDY